MSTAHFFARTTWVCLTIGWMLQEPFAAQCADPPSRTPWTTSSFEGTPEPPLPFVTERIYPRIELAQPTMVVPVPGTSRMLATQLESDLVSFDRDHPHEVLAALKMPAVHPRWYQTLGVALDPGFPQAPWCYVTYQFQEKGDHGVRLGRFRVTDVTTPQIDPESELLIASWRNHGHRGGCIEFGPDGYLYVPIGDGSPPNPPDVLLTGQDLSDLQSAILRIDVGEATASQPYRVPADNPFVNLAGARGEVWAYGFRNPWKIAFHPSDGSLWVGDVGWEMMEMIYRVEKGGNYGWSVMEGSQPVHPESPVGPTPIQPPVVEHTHVEARSVTGGFFYHGERLPQLQGAYLYGDYMTGKVWGLRHDGNAVTWHEELADTPFQIISFALEPNGEIDIVSFDGTLHRLVANPQLQANTDFPHKLSDTGLFSSTASHLPARGVVTYTINAEHFADYTTSERLLALPGDSQLDVFQEDDWEVGQNQGHISFPENTVLAKTVSIDMTAGDPHSRRRLETQILHRLGDSWRAYNYLWNDEQTDAVLQEGGGRDRTLRVRDENAPGGIRRQVWHHAAREECLLCHIWRAGTVHGFKIEQLDRLHASGINQLEMLDELGVFASSPPRPTRVQPSPYDERFSLEERARSYLHLNCAHCHQAGGGGTATFNLRADLPLEETLVVNAAVTQGDFGIADARIVVPGDPYRSVLYYRLAKLGRGHMPQFGTSLADSNGIRLIRRWIQSMPSNEPTSESDQTMARQLGALNTTARSSAGPSTRILQLLDNTTGALMLATAMNEGRLTKKQNAAVLRQAAAHADSQVRDLFERFLPPDQRIERLGDAINEQQLLALPGNADRGRFMFREAAGVTCRNCHRIENLGGQIGPSLEGVGKKYRPAEILDNILAPSRNIDPKYLTNVLETSAGRVLVGLVVGETETQITLREATGKDHIVAKTQIEVLDKQKVSIMPERLLRDFTAQQAADLLAYLQSLK